MFVKYFEVKQIQKQIAWSKLFLWTLISQYQNSKQFIGGMHSYLNSKANITQEVYYIFVSVSSYQDTSSSHLMSSGFLLIKSQL